MDTPEVVRSLITSAIHDYLAALEGKNREGLYDLAKTLDRLVDVYHQTADVEPDTVDSEAPRVEERPISDAASAAHPELGLYAVVAPEDRPDQKVGLGDSVSDLAEIAVDLTEVLWLFENAGHNDAVWQFRFGYQSHWGRHLHEVRTYLHALAAW